VPVAWLVAFLVNSATLAALAAALALVLAMPASAPLIWVAQASTSADAWSQYGPVGITAGMLAVAVGVLFRHQLATQALERAQAKEALEAERKRGDRLEQELRDLHQYVRDKALIALAESTAALRDTLDSRREREGHR
jgi:hypothetical protein